MKRNNHNNNNNNYFTQNIKELGENFLRHKTPRDLEFDANRIFRDLAKAKIQIEKFGGYFLDDTLSMCLMKVANEKYIYYNVIWSGVNMLLQAQPSNGEVLSVFQKVSRSREAYLTILSCLDAVKKSQDFHYLYGLVSQLNQFRFDL